MRVLTVRQPWAWAIVHGGKDVENRVRNIAGDYRGPVAIHAGLSTGSWNESETALQLVHLRTGEDARRHVLLGVRGAIIGVVDLCGVHESKGDGCGTRKGTARLGELIPLCSEWSEPWAHHLVLANPRPLAEPIPFKGALGLRHLDDDTTARIEVQL